MNAEKLPKILEYAQAAQDYEEVCAQGQSGGIVFELNVPKGAKICKNWYTILQRASKFLCTSHEVVIDDNTYTYHHIKLDLLPMDTDKAKCKSSE